MTRMTGPDCVVMCNLINKYIHTYTHTHIHTVVIIYDNNSVIEPRLRQYEVIVWKITL